MWIACNQGHLPVVKCLSSKGPPLGLGSNPTVQEVLDGVRSVGYVPCQLLKSVELFGTSTLLGALTF